MKKYFFILSLLCLGLVSCGDDITIQQVKDPLDYTLVHVYKGSNASDISVKIFDYGSYNANDYSYASAPGNLYVKKGGALEFHWRAKYWNTDYSKSFSKDTTYLMAVDSEQEIWVIINNFECEQVNEFYDLKGVKYY